MPTAIKSYSLAQVRGLTAAEVSKLKKAGIDNTAELLAATRTTRQEQKLAKSAGLTLTRMREAVNRADLMQVSGMGAARADLLENVGVNSARELAQRNPAALSKVLEKYVKAHPELNYRLPSPTTVASLVTKAKALQAPAPAPTPVPVTDVASARPVAAAALHQYIDDVLFSNDPAGELFRERVLGWRPSTEWAQVQQQMHQEVDAFVNHPLQGGERSGYEEQEDDGQKVTLWGRFFGLYTEVTVNKASGKADRVYVEID